jgi:hypothetical protein
MHRPNGHGEHTVSVSASNGGWADTQPFFSGLNKVDQETLSSTFFDPSTDSSAESRIEQGVAEAREPERTERRAAPPRVGFIVRR